MKDILIVMAIVVVWFVLSEIHFAETRSTHLTGRLLSGDKQ